MQQNESSTHLNIFNKERFGRPCNLRSHLFELQSKTMFMLAKWYILTSYEMVLRNHGLFVVFVKKLLK